MNLLDMATVSILSALGCDMSTFTHLFPAAKTMYSIFIAIGLGILLLNFVWQLFKNFGLGMGIEAEDPLKLTMRTILFMLLVLYSGQIVEIALDIGGTPYQWILSSSLPPIEFASFMSAILPIIGSMASGSVTLIALVFIIILAWNYLKLLLEAAERYILLGVLIFTAPVAFSLGGSQTTSNIFKNWCRMLGGQIFLLLMNAWCLKLFTAMVGTFMADPLNVGGGGLFIWMLCAVGFLKIAQKIDSFMSSLGISVGHTGGSMLGDAIIAAKGISGFKKMGMLGGFGGGKSGGGASGASSTGSSPNTGFMSGGLAGAVGRKVSSDTASNLASQPGAEKGGVFAGIGSKMYSGSIGEPGGFASEVIGNVAKGNVGSNGMITGDKAVSAFNAYMGSSGGEIPTASGNSVTDALDGAEGASLGGMDADNIPAGVDSAMTGELPIEPADIPMGVDGEDLLSGADAGDNGAAALDAIEAGELQDFTHSPIPTESGEEYAGANTFGMDAGGSDVSAFAHDQIPGTADSGSSVEYDGFNGGIAAEQGDNGAAAMDAVIASDSGLQSHTSIPSGINADPSLQAADQAVSSAPVSAGISGSAIPSGSEGMESSGIMLGGGQAIPTDTVSGRSGDGYQTEGYSEQIQSAAFAGNYSGGASAATEPPTYRDITMGGGRITGTEVSPQNPKGIQFAMYHTGQYTQPEGQFSVVQSLDGAKWYKQYAQPAVERTPVSEKDGKVTYNEKIVKKLPKGPPRIDRI